MSVSKASRIVARIGSLIGSLGFAAALAVVGCGAFTAPASAVVNEDVRAGVVRSDVFERRYRGDDEVSESDRSGRGESGSRGSGGGSSGSGSGDDRSGPSRASDSSQSDRSGPSGNSGQGSGSNRGGNSRKSISRDDTGDRF